MKWHSTFRQNPGIHEGGEGEVDQDEECDDGLTYWNEEVELFNQVRAPAKGHNHSTGVMLQYNRKVCVSFPFTQKVSDRK